MVLVHRSCGIKTLESNLFASPKSHLFVSPKHPRGNDLEIFQVLLAIVLIYIWISGISGHKTSY